MPTVALALLSGGQVQSVVESSSEAAVVTDGVTGPLVMERGEGELPIRFPRDEELKFDVQINLGILGSPRVGKVTLTAAVEPFGSSPLLTAGGDEVTGEAVELTAVAEGGYQVYSVHDVTSTRILPQEWPHVIHRKFQSGTENRKRELLLGWKDGVHVASLRYDHHCKTCEMRQHFLKPNWVWEKERHCRKCRRAEHRVWKDPKEFESPEEALDMLTAVQLARTMVAEGVATITFTLIDQDELWHVTLKRGDIKRQEVRGGTFDAVEVKMKTRPPPGTSGREEDFEGLFGLHGTISMWFDSASGIPVLIEGRVPVGPLTLDVRAELNRIVR